MGIIKEEVCVPILSSRHPTFLGAWCIANSPYATRTFRVRLFGSILLAILLGHDELNVGFWKPILDPKSNMPSYKFLFFFHYSRSWGRYFRMFYFPFQISNTWFQNLVNPLVLYFSLFSFINFNLWSSQMIMSACLFPLSSFLNFYILSCVYTCGLSVLQHIVYGVLVNLHCAHVFLQDVYNSPVQFVFLHVVFQVLDNSIICY